jgi:hypothetical protein
MKKINRRKGKEQNTRPRSALEGERKGRKEGKMIR